MELELDYVEFGIQAVLTVLAMSVLLLVDFGNLSTFIYLALIPLLFGYTAYISSEGFNKASLASIIALFYAPLGFFMAASGLLVFLINNFVSVFKSQESFRGYYSSTTVPLILTGLTLGALAGSYMFVNPGFEAEMESQIVDKKTSVSMKALEVSGMDQQDQELNETIDMMESTVVNYYSVNADDPETEVLEEAFEELRNNAAGGEGEFDLEDRIEDMLENYIGGKLLLLIIPFSVGAHYALQPVTGLLTAIYSMLFRAIDRRI